MSSEDQNVDCPLCLEPLEIDDISFFPCTCGYQICRFCWHRIRTDENGLCPACRKQYPEDPADFKPLTQEQLHRIKSEKRMRDIQRKQKISENRKHLANVRVVQKNLVFVVGLSQRLADPDILKRNEYFGKFGKVHKVVINHTTSYAGSQGPSASAYVTYYRSEDSLRAIQVVNNRVVDNRTLKASLGTTKYCSHFLKNQPCPKSDCMYLHELGDPAASFTKEEMQLGKHQEYEKLLHDLLVSSSERNKELRKAPSPTNAQDPPQPSSSPPVTSKESWPSLQPGDTNTSSSKSDDKTGNRVSKSASLSNKPASELRQIPNTSIDELTVNGSTRLCDQMSESSQSSSASPVQDNIENWQASGSPLSESSDTDSNTTSQILPDLAKDEPIAEPKLPRPNGYSHSFNETHKNGSLHNCLPPRFQNNAALQRMYPPGMPQGAINLKSINPNHLMNKTLMDNTNPNYSFFSTVNGLRNPAAPQPNLQSSNNDVVVNGLDRTLLTSTDTVPVNTTTDWQAAFGFASSQKTASDDDLGFDPWNESTKGLADLIAKEARNQYERTDPTSNGSYRSHNGYVPSSISKRVSAPPGFSPNPTSYPANPSMRSQTNEAKDPMLNMMMNQRQMLNNRNSQYSLENSLINGDLLQKRQYIEDKSEDKSKNWQAELRAMLPNINISFDSHQDHSSQDGRGSQNYASSQQSEIFNDRVNGSSGWNYPSSNNVSGNSQMSKEEEDIDLQRRVSLAAAQQYAYCKTKYMPQYQWDASSSFSQMPPRFNPHLSAKHHTEQQILGNLPGVL